MTPPDEVKLLPEEIWVHNGKIVDVMKVGTCAKYVRADLATPPPPEPSDEAVREAIKSLWIAMKARELGQKDISDLIKTNHIETLIQAATRPSPALNAEVVEKVKYALYWAHNSLGCIKDAIGGTKEDAAKRSMVGIWNFCVRDEPKIEEALQLLEAAGGKK